MDVIFLGKHKIKVLKTKFSNYYNILYINLFLKQLFSLKFINLIKYYY